MVESKLDYEADIVVIGAGPGGYVGAIRMAQLGFKVICIEKRERSGGTCLNVGCIPSKALLHASEAFYSLDKGHFKKLGVEVDGFSLNLDAMMTRKTRIVDTLSKGISFLLKKNAITSLSGVAHIESAGLVVVEQQGKTQNVGCKHIVIATGSEPVSLPGMVIDETDIVSSTGALSFSSVPEHLIVIGAGVIGLELGSVWSRLGAKVTVVEFLDHIVPGADKELGEAFKRILGRQGLSFMLKHKVNGARLEKGKVKVDLAEIDGSSKSIEGDKLLVAVGRKPYTENLGLENLGIKLDKRGFIEVNEKFETSCPNIYAIGDCIKGPMLAHKAEEDGVGLAEMLAGQNPVIDHKAIPSIIYTSPEVAWVGDTEEALKQRNVDYKKGVFPLKANSRAVTNDCTDGMVKVLADKKTDCLLGVHIMAHEAGTLIQEAVSVIAWGGNAEDIARVCHGHPTLNEAVREAALAADGRAIHM